MIRVETDQATNAIKHAYDQYEKKAYAIFKFYSIEIVKYMMRVQGNASAGTKGAFWTNHTFKAVNAFMTEAWQVPTKTMGVNMLYRRTPWYTDLLENGHDGRFAAIPTLLKVFEPLIIRDLEILYGEG